jgi:hypothetical protein
MAKLTQLAATARPVHRLLLTTFAAGLALCFALAPTRAEASYRTLQRAVGNLVQSPLDVVLSPVTAGQTWLSNLRDIEDTRAVRITYAVPGYFWLTGMSLGAACIRGVTGMIELLPGIALLPFKTDLDPLYDHVANSEGIVFYENEIFPINFGVNYTTATY